MKLVTVGFLLSFVGYCLGDCYMHFPRGSNNRLNEKSANRRNANRVFDSQNNNRGGYNVGDKTDRAFTVESQQYHETFFTSSAQSRLPSGNGKSFLDIEWTNQHGCGGNEDTDPHKLNCNMVIQYLCQQDNSLPAGHRLKLRNGRTTATPNFRGGRANERMATTLNRMNGDLDPNRVLHEQWAWYDKCSRRDRNYGLFTADQNVRKGSARFTRQNRNGNRRGYECPEERDYYPYWHPTEWKDIAVLAENSSRCSFYQSESFNVRPRHECIEKDSTGQYMLSSKYNNQKECESKGGEWLDFYNFLERAPQHTTEAACQAASRNGVKYIWGRTLFFPQKKECLVALPPPDCKEAMWSRVNHLGNGRGGQPLSYRWTIPHFPSGDKQRCVLRIRYNISTDDYDPIKTDSRFNRDPSKGVFSPVENNPTVNVGGSNSPLRLAINTAQYGRTFQDRTHIFMLEKRPSSSLDSKTIYNMGVRGKRGNIVQTFPAVEYDFFPTNLTLKRGELVHIQWTGSNSHNNGAPGGDGQTGDAGEGTGGTDRSNLVEVKDLNNNFPLPFENTQMFKNAKVHWSAYADANFLKRLNDEDIAVTFASSGYYRCVKNAVCGRESVEGKTQMNNLLNNAPASFGGMLIEFSKGKYHYICTRNNSFTNRSQKGTLEVE
ncbi:protein DD3-3-like isoform X2 [Rhopilema esculentum]|uniref:protein DD3-3-like isoform X1 n=1 Tax=Rhopilema esculentum TaxID=499914 RepID=UPI0031DFB5AF